MVPLPSDCIDKIYTEMSPNESTAHLTALEKTLLGELMYAYIVCYHDIRYVVTTLSKFSSSPSLFHYKILTTIYRKILSSKSTVALLSFSHLAFRLSPSKIS